MKLRINLNELNGEKLATGATYGLALLAETGLCLYVLHLLKEPFQEWRQRRRFNRAVKKLDKLNRENLLRNNEKLTKQNAELEAMNKHLLKVNADLTDEIFNIDKDNKEEP